MPRNHHKNAEEKVLEDLKKFLKGNETLIVGVSGGPDSVFLLNCLIEFRVSHKNLQIIVAHVNHMLRGRDAEDDMKFVKELCKKNDLIFESTAVDVEALSKTTKSSIEEAGREIRYGFFEKLFTKYKATYCLTAHHSDDNLETIIFNLIRGASVKGLSGMKHITTKKSGLALARPLLCVSKNEIMEFLKNTKTKYRVDHTNADTKITRNFLRHEIIPLIKKINPNLSQTVRKNASTFEDLEKYLALEAENWIGTHGTKNRTSFPVSPFTRLPEALKKQIILSIYRHFEENTKDIEVLHIEEVIDIIDRNIGKKKKTLGQYTVEINQGRFIFS